MNQNERRKRNLFWKEVIKVNRIKVESCKRIGIEREGWYWERMK